MNPIKQCIQFQSLLIILDISNDIFKSNDNKSITLLSDHSDRKSKATWILFKHAPIRLTSFTEITNSMRCCTKTPRVTVFLRMHKQLMYCLSVLPFLLWCLMNAKYLIRC